MRPKRDEIFHAARKLPNADERAAYLEQACGEDLALASRDRDALLDHDAAKDSLPRSALYPAWASPSTTLPSNSPAPRSVPTSCWSRLAKAAWASCTWRRRREPVRRTVALKIIKPGMDTREVVARFEAERQALAMMDHPEHRQGVRCAARPTRDDLTS